MCACVDAQPKCGELAVTVAHCSAEVTLAQPPADAKSPASPTLVTQIQFVACCCAITSLNNTVRRQGPSLPLAIKDASFFTKHR